MFIEQITPKYQSAVGTKSHVAPMVLNIMWDLVWLKTCCPAGTVPEDKSIRLRDGSILKDALAQDDLSFLHL
jgi:hypothetical protein